MTKPFCLGILLLFSSTLSGQTLDLPKRLPSAPTGSEFVRSVIDVSLVEREEKVLAQVKAGNIPTFLRTLVPLTVGSVKVKLTYYVTPDYLAVGSDDDYFLTPLSPYSAQTIADMLGCLLPTTQMVDDIYANASIKLSPSPIPPSILMITVPVFNQHHQTIIAQLKGKPPGGLVAGHKKDVVIANKVYDTEGKVAIYGWHKLDAQPIQPLYVGHGATWVDYSHGIRLVQRRMMLNGVSKTADEILADPELAPLLSKEGVILRTRYKLLSEVQPQEADRK